MATTSLQRLEGQITCSVCSNRFTDPKMLQCHHAYCKGCLEELLKRAPNKGILTCPSCQKETQVPQEGGISGLVAAFAINEMMELQDPLLKEVASQMNSMPSNASYSSDGGIMGSTDSKFSVEDKLNVRSEVDKHYPPSKPMCKLHERNELQFYCMSCDEVICVRCTIVIHNGHKYELVKKVAEEQKRKIVSEMEKVDAMVGEIKKTLVTVDAKNEEVGNLRTSIEGDIHTIFQDHHEMLSARENELIQQLDRIVNRKLKTLTAERDVKETVLLQANSCARQVEDTLQRKSDMEVLLLKKTLMQRLKETESLFQGYPNLLKVNMEADMVLSVPPDFAHQYKGFGHILTPESINPLKCVAKGRGMEEAIVNKKAAIFMKFWDCKGNPFLKPIPDMECNVIFVRTGHASRCEVHHQNENVYEISYTPIVRGAHEVHIKVDNTHIQGSPFSVIVRSPAAPLTKLKQLIGLKKSEGCTDLMIASLNGNTKDVEELLHGGVSVDSGDNDGKSALVHASKQGHINVARLLLKHGAQIDWQDNEGCTPLMAACHNQHKEMASFLIDSGARVHLRNDSGKTASDFALENNCTDILQLFTKPRIEPSFPGITFSSADVKKVSLTSSAKTINFEEVGISLSIPEYALPSTDPPLEVQIWPCSNGPWEVPKNLELVSSAYIVELSREMVFRKVANLETDKDMTFLSASTTPQYQNDRPVYVFQEITGKKGSSRSREKLLAGEIVLKHLCILGIFRYCLQSHLYSARLYTARERKKVIFCMCPYQPQYIKCCDEEITALYKIQEKARDLVVRDGVTISAEEVCLKPNCSGEWKTLCKTEPTSILKKAIGIHTRYEPTDCNFPKIEIVITNVPRSRDSEPLELRVEGLNVETVFKFPPGEFLTFEVDTTQIKAAMEELKYEIKGQSLECSESNTLSTAKQMLEHMECIEELLQSQNPLPVLSSVAFFLQEIDRKCRLLKEEASETVKTLRDTCGMKVHIEAMSFYSLQMKTLYSVNVHHGLKTGNTSEWHAVASIFTENAANLMSSIKEVLKALKSAQTLPNNCLFPDTSPQPHPFPPALPKYFGWEAPTMEKLCVAVTGHPTGKIFNLAHHISRSWKKIGLKLGIQFNQLKSIEQDQNDDEERLMGVFELWVDNAAGLPHHNRYPLSWQGLSTLLKDIGKMEVAKQYFEFLEKICD